MSIGHVLIFDDVGRPRPLLEVLYSWLTTTRAPGKVLLGRIQRKLKAYKQAFYTVFLKPQSLLEFMPWL